MTKRMGIPALPGEIAVLAGGPAPGREASLSGGRWLHEALMQAGLENRLVTVPERNGARFLGKLECGLALPVLPRRLDGGTIPQEALDAAGIVFAGPDAATCRLAMDRTKTKEAFRRAGLAVPVWTAAENPEKAAAAASRAGLRYPMFVKAEAAGGGTGARRVDSPLALEDAAKTAANGGRVVLEELVVGRPLAAAWLDGRLLPLVDAAHGLPCAPAELDGAAEAGLRPVLAKVAALFRIRDAAVIEFVATEAGPVFLGVDTRLDCDWESPLAVAARADGIGMDRLGMTLAALGAERSLPAFRILPNSPEDDDADGGAVIDFGRIDWKRMGI